MEQQRLKALLWIIDSNGGWNSELDDVPGNIVLKKRGMLDIIEEALRLSNGGKDLSEYEKRFIACALLKRRRKNLAEWMPFIIIALVSWGLIAVLSSSDMLACMFYELGSIVAGRLLWVVSTWRPQGADKPIDRFKVERILGQF
jgi:hypothetical protein